MNVLALVLNWQFANWLLLILCQTRHIAMQHMIAGLRILHPDITDDEVKMLKIEGLMKAKTIIEEETIL